MLLLSFLLRQFVPCLHDEGLQSHELQLVVCVEHQEGALGRDHVVQKELLRLRGLLLLVLATKHGCFCHFTHLLQVRLHIEAGERKTVVLKNFKIHKGVVSELLHVEAF